MKNMNENLAKAHAARKLRGPRKTLCHKVRCANSKFMTISGYTRGLAVKACCTECLGFETHPKDCTSKHCPLYPFRGVTKRTHRGSEER